MLDWLLRGLVVAVLRRLFVVAAAPAVFIIATPVILLRAFVCSARHEEEFKFAVLDGYAAVWDGLVAAFMWPFYSDTDRLEAARRRASNQSLEPTSGRRTEKLKNEL
jgi:hypothetical protein